MIVFDNSYARLPEATHTKLSPSPVSAPKLIAFNDQLAQILGLKAGELSPNDMAQVFSGNHLLDGSDPLATAYSGHQFGNWNPTLGDGRAILLGETIGSDGQRYDIQLKGSGRTPYSRNGDGRAALGPVLREYVVSEAMHALGIPTTRALAAVSTGDKVQRETALPGAIVTRVAASHIRVGTFQYFAARRDIETLRALFDHVVARHYPDCSTPMELFRSVMDRQAILIAHWMSVGFIHGVMNTDNCQIAGETIDYGPCAFMDVFHPDQVFSSIDRGGRYRYKNQPDIGVWNMAQFATSLIPLFDDQDAAIEALNDALNQFVATFKTEHDRLFLRKIGLSKPEKSDISLVADLLTLMAENQADFTNTFRALSGDAARDQFADPTAFDHWSQGWKERLASQPDPIEVMNTSNPAIIARNHRIEEMIQSATQGDYSKFERMTQELARPFDATNSTLTRPPTEQEIVHATFCGT